VVYKKGETISSPPMSLHSSLLHLIRHTSLSTTGPYIFLSTFLSNLLKAFSFVAVWNVPMTGKIPTCCFLHSNYLKQLRRGYERATKEDTVTAASVTEPPRYHMTLMAPNPEQNNNLKSVETQ